MFCRLFLTIIFTLGLYAETSHNWNVKTSSDYASVGETISFIVKIKNTKTIPMKANVLYKFPEEFKFINSNITKISTSSNIMKWEISVAAQSTFTLEIKMKAILGAMKTKNYFQLRSNDQKSFITSDVRVYGGVPSVSINSYYYDNPCVVGEKTAYSVILENRGTSVVTNIQMAINLSKKLRFLSAIVKTRQGVEQKYRWKQDALIFKTHGFLEPGKKIIYDLYCGAKEQGEAQNIVRWSFWELGREFIHEKEMQVLPKNKSSEVASTTGFPNLNVKVEANARFTFLNKKTTFTTVIKNNSNSPVYNVEVEGMLPDEFEYISSKPQGAYFYSKNEKAKNRWKFAEIAPNEEIEIKVIARTVGLNRRGTTSVYSYNGRSLYFVLAKVEDREFYDSCAVRVQ